MGGRVGAGDAVSEEGTEGGTGLDVGIPFARGGGKGPVDVTGEVEGGEVGGGGEVGQGEGGTGEVAAGLGEVADVGHVVA